MIAEGSKEQKPLPSESESSKADPGGASTGEGLQSNLSKIMEALAPSKKDETSTLSQVTEVLDGRGGSGKKLAEEGPRAEERAIKASKTQSGAFSATSQSDSFYALEDLRDDGFFEDTAIEEIAGLKLPPDGGILVLVCREDPRPFAIALAQNSGVKQWYVPPQANSVDMRRYDLEELADKWVGSLPPSAGAMPDSPRRVICSDTLYSKTDLPQNFRLYAKIALEELGNILEREETTVVLPIKTSVDSDRLFLFGAIDLARRSAICVALAWERAVWWRAVHQKGLPIKLDLLAPLKSLDLPYENGRLVASSDYDHQNADRDAFDKVTRRIDNAKDSQDVREIIQKIVHEEKNPTGDRRSEAAKEIAKQESDLNALLFGSDGLRNEVAGAMLFVAAFADRPSMVDFRELVSAILPHGPVDHLEQLGRGARARMDAEIAEARRLNKPSPELLTWTDAFNERFDETFIDVDLRAEGGRVVLGPRWSRIDAARIIVEQHSMFIAHTLAYATARGEFFRPNESRSAALFGLFGRVDSRMPGTILDVDALARAFGSVPNDERYSDNVVLLVRDLGRLLKALFESAEPKARKDALGSRFVARLAELWRNDHAHILGGALLLALRESPEFYVDALWNTVRTIFQRSESDLRLKLLGFLVEIVGAPSRDGSNALRKWLIAGKDPHRSDETWEGAQTLLRETIVQSDILWRARSYGDRAKTLGGFLLLEGSDLDDAARGFLAAVYGEPPLKAIKRLHRVLLIEEEARHAGHEQMPFEHEMGTGRMGYQAEFIHRLRDVFWVLADGVDEPDLEMDSELFYALEEVFRSQLCALAGAPCKNYLFDISRFVMKEAYADDAARPGPAARLAALFPAAALANWRFVTRGVESVSKGDPYARRMEA